MGRAAGAILQRRNRRVDLYVRGGLKSNIGGAGIISEINDILRGRCRGGPPEVQPIPRESKSWESWHSEPGECREIWVGQLRLLGSLCWNRMPVGDSIMRSFEISYGSIEESRN